ncbi:MAG: AraC family transcriptional regulator [Lachnospiraceae bacterium]
MELLSYGHTVQEKGWSVHELVRAGFVRVYKVETGCVYYHASGKSMRLTEGKVYLLPSHSGYALSYDSSTRFLCTWVHMNIYPEISQEIVALDEETAPLCMDVFALVRQIVIKDQHNAFAMQQSMELFYHYYLAYKMKQKSNDLANLIADQIEKEPEKKLSITELAKDMGYTKEHYIRVFQKQTGMTPYQYSISCRMVRAGSLLRQDYHVGEVSSRVGYEDVRTFESGFKKFYGITPSAYKKKYRNNNI